MQSVPRVELSRPTSTSIAIVLHLRVRSGEPSFSHPRPDKFNVPQRLRHHEEPRSLPWYIQLAPWCGTTMPTSRRSMQARRSQCSLLVNSRVVLPSLSSTWRGPQSLPTPGTPPRSARGFRGGEQRSHPRPRRRLPHTRSDGGEGCRA